MIIDKYQAQGHNVERSHIEYRMELRTKGSSMKGALVAPRVIDVGLTDDTVISDLSGTITSDSNCNNQIDNDKNEDLCEPQEVRKGGRTKGTTIKELKKKLAV
jgi:hypothetical protein